MEPLQLGRERRFVGQARQAVEARLLGQAALVFQKPRAGAKAGEQFAEHDRRGEEVVKAPFERGGDVAYLGTLG
jgi:hypothetical protein